MKTKQHLDQSPATPPAATDPQQRADNTQRIADHCQQIADKTREAAEAAQREHDAAEQGVAQAEPLARQTAALLPDIEAKPRHAHSDLAEAKPRYATVQDE